MIYAIIAAVVIAVLSIVVIGISCYENRTLTVSRYVIASSKIPEGFSGKRIVLLADLHNTCFGTNNDTLLQKVEAETPDYVVLAGDMIVSDVNSDYSATVELLRKISQKYPIYYEKGNHEMRVAVDRKGYGRFWDMYKADVQDYVTFLDNESAVLYRGNDACVRLTGLDTDKRYYKRFRRAPMEQEYLRESLGEVPDQTYEILIAHHPAYFKEYAEWGADLVLSGHIHGGMVRLPFLRGMISPTVQFFPKYDRGRFEEQDSVMILSGGLGNHTLRIRINNLPEIVVVDFKHENEQVVL